MRVEDAMSRQDDDVWTRVKGQKEEAFRWLFETYHRSLCFFAARITRDEGEAEDIVQEVFMAFWKQEAERFPTREAVKTWLYNSVQARCLNFLRDREIQQRHYEQLPREEADEDYFLCQQIRAEVVAEIYAAVEELPERMREIFKKSYIDEEPDKQIAEELHITLNTIKTQKARAKEYLRVRLGDLFALACVIFPGL